VKSATNPLVQARRGFVGAWRMPSA
jgi:hypothetical protein